MAGRNVKRGLVFFRMDCDFLRDRKVRRILRKWKSDGPLFYVALLCEVYRDKGYYINLDDDLIPDVADACGIDEDKAQAIFMDCVEAGLFDSAQLESKGILTSKGIQRRYMDIMAGLRRKGGIDSEISLISSEETQDYSEETHNAANNRSGNTQDFEQTPKITEEMRISSDKRKEDKIIEEAILTHTHTGLLKEGDCQGETIAEVDTSEPLPDTPQAWQDNLAEQCFGRQWNDLKRHERMMVWAQFNFPLLFEFERPLTVENCRGITERISDWRDIARICEAMANRKDILVNHVSAVSTFWSFARMDKILKEKQKL